MELKPVDEANVVNNDPILQAVEAPLKPLQIDISVAIEDQTILDGGELIEET